MTPTDARARIASLAPQLPAKWAYLARVASLTVDRWEADLAHEPGAFRDVAIDGAERSIRDALTTMALRIAEPAPFDPTTIPHVMSEADMRRTLRSRRRHDIDPQHRQRAGGNR